MNLLIAREPRVCLATVQLPYQEKKLSGMTYRPIGIAPLRNYGTASYRAPCVLHRVKSEGGKARTSYGDRVSIHERNQRTPIRSFDSKSQLGSRISCLEYSFYQGFVWVTSHRPASRMERMTRSRTAAWTLSFAWFSELSKRFDVGRPWWSVGPRFWCNLPANASKGASNVSLGNDLEKRI